MKGLNNINQYLEILSHLKITYVKQTINKTRLENAKDLAVVMPNI